MKKRINNKHQDKKLSVGFKTPAVLVSILAMFVVATVFFAIEASTLGAKLVQLEDEQAKLVKEKQELSNQLVNSSSLSSMSEKAEELGFKKPSDVIYVSEKEAVAKLP